MKNKLFMYDYTIDNHVVDRVTEMRDLGVIMDRKLSFAAHTEYITNKSKAILQFVKRQSLKFDTDVKKILLLFDKDHLITLFPSACIKMTLNK